MLPVLIYMKQNRNAMTRHLTKAKRFAGRYGIRIEIGHSEDFVTRSALFLEVFFSPLPGYGGFIPATATAMFEDYFSF